jgi:hypothetical protein
MGMGMGGIQPLITQLRGQGAFGNPYVSPALTAQPATPQQGPTPQGGFGANADGSAQMGNAPRMDMIGLPSTNQPAPQPINGYTPTGSGSPAGLSSILSGNSAAPSSSNSLNTAPNMGGSGGSGGPFPLQGQYGIVKMANGGLAGAAQNMANKGRDGDSMLVHMSPGEVKGLQALAMAHGGSLSINPDTGLVEASFLKRILPMVAGAGLMMIPGVNAAVAAGMVGGFETLRTGDIGKGLMAGLGAYGGAGLAGNLAGAGAGAANTSLTEATLSANPNITASEIGREMTTPGFNALTVQPNANPATMTMADKIGAGFNQVTSSPEALGGFAKQNLMNIGAAAAPALGDAMTPKGPAVPGMPEEDERYKGSPYRYNLAPGFQGSMPTRPSPYYTPTGLGYAEGGDVMMAAGGTYDDEPMGDAPGMASGGIAAYRSGGLKMGEGIARDTDTDTASLNAFEAAKKRMSKINKAANMPKNYAAQMPQVRGLGEIAVAQGGSIGGYSDGGRMLKGPGDGMSDSIPATIGKRQPARLADGEFVVPADVVSHLGNGSTDAGARKLYSMMDKVRTARTGKKKQAPAVKTDKYMPA